MTSTQSFLEIRDIRSGECRRRPLGDSPIIIGRGGDNEVTLASDVVSRRHAELVRGEDGDWSVRDLRSRNGTVLNGRPLGSVARFVEGDVLQIGDYELVFRGDAVPDLPGAPNRQLTVVDGHLSNLRSLSDLDAPKISAERLKPITELSRLLLQTDDDDKRLRALCATLVGRIFPDATATVVQLPDRTRPDQLELLLPPVPAPRTTPHFSRTLLSAVVSTGSAVMASGAHPSMPSPDMVEFSVFDDQSNEAAIGCPLDSAERSARVLYVTIPGAYATSEWLALASLTAEQYQVAESTWRARRRAQAQALLANELDQAREIQMRWVPDDFTVDGLEVGFGFEPCGWVGGDYVDGVPMPDGRHLLTVMDVCGKGMSAALITNGLHTSIHLLASHGLTLPELTASLNRHLIATLPPASFVTAALVAIDPESGELEAVNCGHPPVLVLAPDGEISQLGAGRNLPLGQFDLELESETRTLRPGEVTIAYSDGLTETFDSEDEILGISGLEELIRRGHQRSTPTRSEDSARTARLRRQLLTLLNYRRGGLPLSDDLCFFLALKT